MIMSAGSALAESPDLPPRVKDAAVLKLGCISETESTGVPQAGLHDQR